MQRVTHVVSGGFITTRNQKTELTMESFDIASPKKAKVVCSAGKVMIIISFDERGFLYQHTVCQSHTVTAVYYQEVLQEWITNLKKKIPSQKG